MGVNEYGLNVGNNYLFVDKDVFVRGMNDEKLKEYLERAEALLVIANNLADKFDIDKSKLFVEFNYHDNHIIFKNRVGDRIVYVVNDAYEVIIDSFYDVGGVHVVEYFVGVDGSGIDKKSFRMIELFKKGL